MKSTNPMFSNIEKNRESAQDRTYSNVATFRGIITKTLILIAVAIGAGLGLYFGLGTSQSTVGLYATLLSVSFVVALVSVIIAMFSVRLAPIFSIIYAACEGLVLVFISLLLEQVFPGIAITAIIGTVSLFVVMLALYSSKAIRVTSKFIRVMLAAVLAILLLSVIVLMISLFNPSFFTNASGESFFWISLGITGLFILYGAFMLTIDFERANQIVSMELDKKYEWSAALGLMISLVWIYIYILRFLVLILGRSK